MRKREKGSAMLGMQWAQRRAELMEAVREILNTAQDGYLGTTSENQSIDFKEEAGRRAQNGELLPGKPQNSEAATKLADEVACMANSPGGGVLIVGVEDATGRILGTELGTDWLRQQINNKVDVAPDIQEFQVGGLRVLVIFVAQAMAPVYDTGDKLRWRVGDSCKPVDVSEWWQHRESSMQLDVMAQPSGLHIDKVRANALDIVRQWSDNDSTQRTDEELLRSLGALRSDGQLTAAAALLLTPLDRVALELTVFDVPGGSVLNRVVPSTALSLAEQIEEIVKALRIINTMFTVEKGAVHRQVRRIPESAVREAIINGVVHRDWNRSEPTDVRWTQSDSLFEVRSPGDFVGEVNENNILSVRAARYPALADLFRAVGLVDKQGVGVDRMYRSMITLGHRPPTIRKTPGPFVHATLKGGAPSTPVVELVEAIRPAERQKDYRLAILLFHLLHNPFITVKSLASALQSAEDSAELTIETALQTAIGGAPMLRKVQDVWALGERAIAIIEESTAADSEGSSSTNLLTYRSTEPSQAKKTVNAWLSEHSSITTGELMELAGIARGTAKRLLDELVDDEVLVAKGKGRSSRFEYP